MEKELTAKQLKTITYLLQESSIEATAKKAKIARGTIYNWLNQKRFNDRLKQERESLFEEGLNALKGATSKAAKTLIELLESKDRNTRRLAAQQIISIALKVAEIKDLEERISRLEELLEQNQYKH